MREKEIAENGLYIVSDQYFQDFPSKSLMQNKDEARPNYFAVKDADGVYWMLPLSSRVAAYKEKAAKYQKNTRNDCPFYAFVEIASVERVVLVGDMFPVLPRYILRPYTIGGVPYIVKNLAARKRIRKKAMRYLSMIRNGVMKSPANILDIKKQLLK